VGVTRSGTDPEPSRFTDRSLCAKAPGCSWRIGEDAEVTGAKDFVEALMRAPAGVSLLHALEVAHRSDVPWFRSPRDSDAAAVHAAVDSIGVMSFGDLVHHAVSGAAAWRGGCVYCCGEFTWSGTTR
jgi:hypothetical protein